MSVTSRSLATTLLALLVTAGPLVAQGGLYGQAGGGPEAGTAEPPAAAPFDPSTLNHAITGILEKLRAKQDLNFIELLVYLRSLEHHPGNLALVARSQAATREAELPAQAWAMIATRLHAHFYEADRDLEFFGIDLFLEGSESQGWEDVDLFGAPPPKFVIGPGGARVDAAHAFAGVASLVMRRHEVNGTLMGHVNTGWGDGVQVAGARIRGATGFVRGVVTRDPERRRRAGEQWRGAPGYKPPEQRAGNRLGNLARDFLQEDRGESLSHAFNHAYARWRLERSAP